MFECVINISEGQRPQVVAAIASAAGPLLLDAQADPHHHRAVLTLGGPLDALEQAARRVAAAGIARLELAAHAGVHPRIGVVDVVPFVDLRRPREVTAAAMAARDRFAAWAGTELGLPCFCYGADRRSLPDIRRGAWSTLSPDAGPPRPHPSAGGCAVGARAVLVAYNLWLADNDLALAKTIAAELRSPTVRALGLQTGARAQVSCNLLDPWTAGPAEIYDAVAARAVVARAELVGLLPAGVLAAIPALRWRALDLDSARMIESRLEEAGFDPRDAERIVERSDR